MHGKPNIVLVGFMGTGKSSVARALARSEALTFTDMDDVLVARAGKPIPRIFTEDGEPHFRALERHLVRELAAQAGRVIATGGGIVLNPANIADYSATGLVVCLTATVDTILARVGRDTNRPLLAAPDKRARILELLAARQPLYDAIPCQVATDGRTVAEVAARIRALYHACPADGSPPASSPPHAAGC